MSEPHGRAPVARTLIWLCLFALAPLCPSQAGQAAPGGPPAPTAFGGPPAPVAPEVVTRDPVSGRATIRAVRIDHPVKIDGHLDEPVYAQVRATTGFIQMEPHEGAPASDRTDVWVLFDRDQIYVTIRCWESFPDRILANELRRDNTTILTGNDHVAFVLDTFYDQRNGVFFGANAAGGRVDGQFSNLQFNGDYNPVWDVAAARFEGGWIFEAAVPFKTLRYRPGPNQVWGFNAQRGTPSRNEWALLTRVPASYASRGIMQTALAATLVGLEVPEGSKNLEIKPFAISDLTTDATAVPRLSDHLAGHVGADLKYGVTRNLTADFTYNTDFAQVEADEQQVNLTRFSLFFPEKREFFLENQGTFAFGGVPQTSAAGDVPILFYSRRIGLDQGRAIPIEAGGRLTGRIGRYTVGLLNIHADKEDITQSPATAFSVVRLKRDVFRRSSVGVLFTDRSKNPSSGASQTYGVDGTFLLFDNLNINTYWARTKAAALEGDDESYRAQLDYAGDRYGVQLERLRVGDHFSPDTGYLRRDNMRKSFGLFRFSPRPSRAGVIRRYVWTGSATYIENGAGHVESRDQNAEFDIEFQNGDKLIAVADRAYEFLPRPFPIAAGVTLPVGGYSFSGARVGFTLGTKRLLSGAVLVEAGQFYDGTKTGVSFSKGRVNLSSRLSAEPSLSINWVDVAGSAFTTRLAGSRITYAMTPLMFASALVQYNSSSQSIAANVRLRWEYRPGSELFLVYNEQRDTVLQPRPALLNRAIIVKINKLFRL